MKEKHSNCENCNQQIGHGQKLCEECVAKIERDLEDVVEEHADAGTFRGGCFSLLSTRLNGALKYLTTKATSQHAAYKEYGDKASRRATFIGRWPSRLSLQEAERFASWGFFYTGRGDLVRCFQCGIGLCDWSEGADPLREHIRHSPNCQLLQNALLYSRTFHMNKVKEVLKQCFHSQSQTDMPSERNIHRLTTDIDEESITQRNEKHTVSGLPNIVRSSINRPEGDQGGVSIPKKRVQDYATEDQRVSSYVNWPQDIEQTTEQLTRAGFYYTGDSDTVCCFICNVKLRNWLPSDRPFYEHARWSPNCPLVIQVLGQGLVDLIRQKESRRSIEQEAAAINGTTDIFGSTDKLVNEMKSRSHSDDGENDIRATVEENKALKLRITCKVCFRSRVKILFLPCQHLWVCQPCGKKIGFCPRCGKPVKEKITVNFEPNH